MAKTSNPDATVARRDTTFPSKNAGFLDTSQIDVGVGMVFESTFGFAVALTVSIRLRKNGKEIQRVIR